MILACVVILIAHFIPVPTTMDNDGVLEDFTGAVNVILDDSELILGVIFIMLFNAIQANLGMTVIKRKNAVIKATVALMLIPSLWLYQITVDSIGEKEDTHWMKAVGVIVMIIGSIWYIIADQIMESEIYSSDIGRINKKKEAYL